MRKIQLLIILLLISITGTATKAQVPCDTPDVALFGSYKTDVTATAFWAPVPGATSYNLKFRIRNSGSAYSAPIPVNDTITVITGLTPLTNYEFIVQTVCGTDTSPYSPSGWVTTLANPSTATLTRGPFMTYATSESVTIQWSTSVACNSEVRFGTAPGNLGDAVQKTAATTSHEIVLTNLTPNTKYYYSVGQINHSMQSGVDNYFHTAPIDNDIVPLKFWVTGDFGTGYNSQLEVRNAFKNHTTGQRVDGWLWLGDNAYANGTDQEYQEKVFDIYPHQMKNIPLFPALGNHDYAQCGYLSSAARGTNFPYFSIFSIPSNSGTEKYYSTNYGNVHFIALDSYGSYNAPSSPMYNWLQADLESNTQQWTVVYFHHPPYSKGSHDSDHSTELVDIRNNIIPLLESYGVDLVLSGHSHAYERSKFIKGHYGIENTFNSSHVVQAGPGPYVKTSRTGDGTIYAVCGVSGKLSGTVSGYPHDAMHYSSVSHLGSLIIDVTGGNLTCSFLTSTGTIEDQFTITKPTHQSTTEVHTINGTRDHGIKIFPNPANDVLNIVLEDTYTSNVEIKLNSLLGQEVYTRSIPGADGSQSIQIDMNKLGLSSGMYFVTIRNGNDLVSKPVMFE